MTDAKTRAERAKKLAADALWDMWKIRNAEGQAATPEEIVELVLSTYLAGVFEVESP